MTEDLEKLSIELRQIAEQIAAMKDEEIKMAHGPERNKFKQEIRLKQHQALFYINKVENLQKRKGAHNK